MCFVFLILLRFGLGDADYIRPWRGDAQEGKVDVKDIPLLAAYGASTITRVTSRIGFSKQGRGVVTGDMLGEIGAAYEEIFGEGGEKEWKGVVGREEGKL